MEYTYKPTEYEIKLIVLYTVKNLKVPSTYTLLDYVISSCANVNYFEMGQYVTELMDTDNLTDYEADGERYFSITDTGEETLGFFESKIPGSIKLSLKDKIFEINKKSRLGNKLYADYFPINENEYTVKFSLEEGGVVMLSLELYAGSKERAIEMCRYLKNDTLDFYKSVIELVEQGITKKPGEDD